MKICWDNLEKLRYKNGYWVNRKNSYFIYKECCFICGEDYLTNKFYPSNYCSRTCCHVGKSPGTKGVSMSEETKEKLRQKLSGKNHPNYGKHHSKETREKIRQTKLGEKNPMYEIGNKHPMFGKKHKSESIKKMSDVKIGKKMPNDFSEKMSKITSGRVLGSPSDQTKRKMSKAKLGCNLSEEHKKNIRKTNRSEQMRKKFSELMKGRFVGESHPNWKGGISYEPYCPAFSNKEWREYIFERDKEKHCWNPQCLKNGKLEVLHHINYDKKDCRYLNIIKICNGCNTQANFNRTWWKAFYTEIMRRRNL